MLADAEEEITNTKAIFSYELQHMDTLVWTDQQKPIFISFVLTQDSV